MNCNKNVWKNTKKFLWKAVPEKFLFHVFHFMYDWKLYRGVSNILFVIEWLRMIGWYHKPAVLEKNTQHTFFLLRLHNFSVFESPSFFFEKIFARVISIDNGFLSRLNNETCGLFYDFYWKIYERLWEILCELFSVDFIEWKTDTNKFSSFGYLSFFFKFSWKHLNGVDSFKRKRFQSRWFPQYCVMDWKTVQRLCP